MTAIKAMLAVESMGTEKKIYRIARPKTVFQMPRIPSSTAKMVIHPESQTGLLVFGATARELGDVMLFVIYY